MKQSLQKTFCLILTAVLLFGSSAPTLLASSANATASEKKSQNAPKYKVRKAETPPPDNNAYPPLLIGPGDILSIVVYGEQALTVDYQVDSDGIITYPYIGNVFLGGMTPAEASAKLAKLLIKPRKVTVLIKESNTYWVSIMGNVPKPGKYQIRGKPTLLSALAEAGGPLPGSDMGGAMLIHKNMKLRVNLDKYLKDEGRMDSEPLMYPGDLLMVQKSGWPTVGEFAIAASILASLAVVAVQLGNLK